MTLLNHLPSGIMSKHIEPNHIDFNRFRFYILVIAQSVKKGWHEGLDDERAILGEMMGDIHKTFDLLFLSEKVKQRIPHHIDQVVGAGHRYISKVANDHREFVTARLGSQLVNHRG